MSDDMKRSSALLRGRVGRKCRDEALRDWLKIQLPRYHARLKLLSCKIILRASFFDGFEWRFRCFFVAIDQGQFYAIVNFQSTAGCPATMSFLFTGKLSFQLNMRHSILIVAARSMSIQPQDFEATNTPRSQARPR